MRLFPKELVIEDNDGFSTELDIFNQKDFGESLGNIFCEVEDPMVVVLDAPWGSGKTTFTKMWCGYMRSKGVPVIYFDAFKNDYISSPFAAIAGEIVAYAECLGGDDDVTRSFVSDATRVAKNVLKYSAVGAVKKLAEKVFDCGAIEKVSNELSGNIEGVGSADKEFYDLIDTRNADKDAFNSFYAALMAISQSMSNGMTSDLSGDKDSVNKNNPLVFVIDELDRCRPPFALEIIETAKHFFSVEGVHFLFVTHLNQLENAVRHTYGIGDNAPSYLQKFYHLVVSLPNAKVRGETIRQLYINKVFQFINDAEDPRFIELLIEYFDAYSEENLISLRDIERVAINIALFVASTNRKYKRIAPIVVGLAFIKVFNYSLFRKIQSKEASFDDVARFLGLDLEKAISGDSFSGRWWAYCLFNKEQFSANVESFEGMRNITFGMRDRYSLVSYMCTWMETLKISS